MTSKKFRNLYSATSVSSMALYNNRNSKKIIIINKKNKKTYVTYYREYITVVEINF